MKNYIATLTINGEDQDFSGTAVTMPLSTKSDIRTLSNSEEFRVTNIKPETFSGVSGDITVNKAIKSTQINVNFENLYHRQLQLLKNFADSNQAFEIQLLAFDAAYTDGTLLRSQFQPDTIHDPPVIFNRSPFVTVSNNIAGNMPSLSSFEYRVAAVFTKDGSDVSIAETLPCNSVYVYTDATDNYIQMKWEHISGAIAYKVYGRTVGNIKYLTTIDASTVDGSNYINFTDDTVTYTESSTDSTSPYKIYSGSFEYRWNDDPLNINITKNGVSIPFRLQDHNNNIVQSGAGCNVYSKYGIVEFTTPILPTDIVKANYYWEPKVTVQSLESTPTPNGSSRVYTSQIPSITEIDGIKVDSTMGKLVPDTLYNVNLTLFINEH